MKQQCLILSLLLFLTISYSSAQSTAYNKFLVEGAHWKIDKSYCDFFGTCDPGGGAIATDLEHDAYKLEGDTVINSIIYKMMFKASWYQCYTDPNFITACPHRSPGGTWRYQLYALLTEDTIARKVYWQPVNTPQCTSDSVLFDFSRGIDSFSHLVIQNFNVPVSICLNAHLEVDSINYSLFESFNRKTWYFRDTSGTFWGPSQWPAKLYEGIGYSYGFDIEYYDQDGYGNPGSFLISYCVGSDSMCGGDFTYLSNNEVPSDNMNITIQPNPATNFIVVNSPETQIKKIEIWDINGRKIGSSISTELDISQLAPSVYIVIVNTNIGTAIRRFVKL